MFCPGAIAIKACRQQCATICCIDGRRLGMVGHFFNLLVFTRSEKTLPIALPIAALGRGVAQSLQSRTTSHGVMAISMSTTFSFGGMLTRSWILAFSTGEAWAAIDFVWISHSNFLLRFLCELN